MRLIAKCSARKASPEFPAFMRRIIAITESMGPIVDHEFEHLGHGDQMIIQTRRRLVQVALALQNDGKVPPGVDHPELYLQAYAGDFVTDSQGDALELYATSLRTRVDRNGTVHAPDSQKRGEAQMRAAR
jgi:hypothetical protein